MKISALLTRTTLPLRRLTYRATKLFSIPIPTLVKILGLDLPEPPRVSLHGIASDSVTLHWSAPEKAASVEKHIIQIDGKHGIPLYPISQSDAGILTMVQLEKVNGKKRELR